MRKIKVKDIIVYEPYQDYFALRINLRLKVDVVNGKISEDSKYSTDEEKIIYKAIENYKSLNPKRQKTINAITTEEFCFFKGAKIQPLSLVYKICKVEFLEKLETTDSVGFPLKYEVGEISNVEYADIDFQ